MTKSNNVCAIPAPEVDGIIDDLCNTTRRFTVINSLSGRVIQVSYFRNWARLYINTGAACRNYALDLDEPRSHLRGPISALLQWANDKEDEDAET